MKCNKRMLCIYFGEKLIDFWFNEYLFNEPFSCCYRVCFETCGIDLKFYLTYAPHLDYFEQWLIRKIYKRLKFIFLLALSEY